VILPTKHLREDRALISIGAELLSLLNEPKTVSRLWDELRRSRADRPDSSSVPFDWFILALDLLYLLGTIDLERGRLSKVVK